MSFFRKFFAEEIGIKYINPLKGFNIHDYYNLYLSSVNYSIGCSETNGIAALTIYDKYYSILDSHVLVEYGDITDSKNKF